MMNGTALNLNVATRPLRNRRLYAVVVRALVALAVLFAVASALVVMKYGGEASRLRSSGAEARKLQGEAAREEKRLTADIRRQERLGQARVDLVNGIILKKTFLWTALLSEFEKALPGPSYITALSPDFTADGAVAMHMRVTSRSLDDLTSFIDNLTAGGFKNIRVFGDRRSEDGRIISEISLTYERAL